MKKRLIIEGIDTSWEGSSGAAERRVWEWEKMRLWSIWEVELRGGFVKDSSLSVKNAVLHDLINGVGVIAPPNPVPAIESRTRKFQFLFIALRRWWRRRITSILVPVISYIFKKTAKYTLHLVPVTTPVELHFKIKRCVCANLLSKITRLNVKVHVTPILVPNT